MEEFDFDEFEKNMNEINSKLTKQQDEGLKNTYKHFDRIHDKLFSTNTVLIAGFFALIKFSENVSKFSILIPVFNMVYLIWIEYRMMEKSRFEADIMNKTPDEIDRWGKKIENTNFYSLISIALTILVLFSFVYSLCLSLN